MIPILMLAISQFFNGITAEKHVCEFPNWTISKNTIFYYQRLELANAVECVERCIENSAYCRAVLFIKIKTNIKNENRRRNFCQFYNTNSESIDPEIRFKTEELQEDSDLKSETVESVVFELLNHCPTNAFSDDDATSIIHKLSVSTKHKLQLIASAYSNKFTTSNEKISEKTSHTRSERLDDNDNKDLQMPRTRQTVSNPSLFDKLKDGIMPGRDNTLELSGNSYVTGQQRKHNENVREHVLIGTSDSISPIRPVFVSHGGYSTPQPQPSSLTQPLNCKNGICETGQAHASESYQKNSAFYSFNEPCSARHSTDPCAPKKTPQWSEWSPDGACSVACGKGTRKRIRFCSTGSGCVGESTKEERCEIAECNVWGKWSEWSRCTVSCGKNGQMMRERRCRNGNSCEGPSVDVRACGGEVVCPAWASWTAWSATCSTSCGKGWRTRQRECLPKGQNCQDGSAIDKQPCELRSCPTWANWESWSECTKSCGSGETIRRRECLNGLGSDCSGRGEERNVCNNQECPAWTQWTLWSACSQTCGDEGSQLRSRECRFNGLISNSCEGPAQDQTACQLQPCPHWDAWSEWSGCSSTCGHGQQKRTRGCRPQGQGCKGGNQEIRFCQLAVCPYFDQWTEWSGCSVTCGRGSCERRRKCHKEDPLPGAVLPSDEELKGLHSTDRGREALVPLDLSPPHPSTLDSFEETVRGEAEKANRKVNAANKETIKAELIERSKNLISQRPRLRGQPLEVVQSSSTYLTDRRRSAPVRNMNNPVIDSIPGCVGPELERKECDAGPCCSWTQWTGWTQCNARCGVGTKARNRKCIVEPDFVNSISPTSFALLDNYHSITPTNSGVARPKRQFAFPSYASPQSTFHGNPLYSNDFGNSNFQNFMSSSISGVCDCPGRSIENEECSIATPNTDLCSSSGDGSSSTFEGRSSSKQSHHHTLNDDVSATNFFDRSANRIAASSRHSTISRNSQSLCVWEEWTEWNSCNGVCTKARHSRSRECLRQDVDCECNGENYETEECQLPHCIQTFTLPSSTNGYKPLLSLLPPHEADSAKLVEESEALADNHSQQKTTITKQTNNMNSQCYWTAWSVWSECNNGGDSLKKRKRLCVGMKAIINNCNCEGVSIDQAPCNNANAAGFGQIRKIERLSIVPNNNQHNNASPFALNVRNTRRERFQDPHWKADSIDETESIRQQDLWHPDDLESQTKQTTATSSTLITKNQTKSEEDCFWNEWKEWSVCASLSSDNDCRIDAERTRSRVCPCSVCEDGISQESESCVLENCQR